MRAFGAGLLALAAQSFAALLGATNAQTWAIACLVFAGAGLLTSRPDEPDQRSKK